MAPEEGNSAEMQETEVATAQQSLEPPPASHSPQQKRFGAVVWPTLKLVNSCTEGAEENKRCYRVYSTSSEFVEIPALNALDAIRTSAIPTPNKVITPRGVKDIIFTPDKFAMA